MSFCVILSNTNSITKLQKSLKMIYDDLRDAETGPDSNNFGFKNRLQIIYEDLAELEPKLVSEFPELKELGTLEDFNSVHYYKGDSGIAQLLKSKIKKISIEVNLDLEGKNNDQNTIQNNQNHIMFPSIGTILRLNNREINAIFFHSPIDITININSIVKETGLDIEFRLMSYDDYLKLKEYWDNHPGNPRNSRGVYSREPPKPSITDIFSRRTNIIEQSFSIEGKKKYAWVLNNSYSKLNDKTVTTKIEFQSKQNENYTKKDLPIIENLKDVIPSELFEDLKDANDCYLHEHNRQSAIMFRKALETAIKLKILQSSLDANILKNNDGNQLRLSEKLSVLVSNNLISSKIKSEMDDTVKWFGDSGVHTKMHIVNDDIRQIIEPKFRKFLSELNLSI